MQPFTLEEVWNDFHAAALEIYEHDPRRLEKWRLSNEERIRRGPRKPWRAPDCRREWRDAGRQAVAEWGRRAGVELTWRKGRIRVYRARRCAGVCGRWLADLGVSRISQKLCGESECHRAYEAARKRNQRAPEWYGATASAPAKREDRRHWSGDAGGELIGAINWLAGYGRLGSLALPRDLLAQRDQLEAERRGDERAIAEALRDYVAHSHDGELEPDYGDEPRELEPEIVVPSEAL